MAWQVGRDPASLLPVLRRSFVRFWASRGGGFYGLGYVVTFVALEIASLSGDLISVSGLVAQGFQYVIRFSIESFLNGLFALAWPVYLFRWLGASGLIVLAAGYAAFDLAIRPAVEAWLPELKEASAELARRKQEKKARKRSQRTNSGP
jgi:hypothetical protein